MTPHDRKEATLRPGAALLAWILPGLGHIAIGQKRRGFLMMSGVLFLFFAGLLIGGVDVVDMKRDRLWFLAQACNGPIAFIADLHALVCASEPSVVNTSCLSQER